MEKRKRLMYLAASEWLSNSSSFVNLSEENDELWEEDFSIILPCLSARAKKPKIRNYMETVSDYSATQFKEHFRLDRDVVEKIVREYEKSTFYRSSNFPKNYEITAETAVLMFLWFCSNKTTLRDVADRFGVCPATVFRYNDTVMDYLISIASKVIKLPEDKKQASSQFEEVYGMSGVLGIIDGTHIRIRTPKHKERTMYGDRNKQTTLGLQVICDDRRKFIDVCTGFPGKFHDATMFSLSEISEELPSRFGETYHLVGDSAYANQLNLITPYSCGKKGLTLEEHEFNTHVSRMRVLVEHSIGLLKNVFQGLLNIAMWEIDKISKFIICCCVLHNLRIDRDFIIERTDSVTNWTPLELPKKILEKLGKRKRNNLMSEIFSRT